MPSHQHSQPSPQAPERRAFPIVLDKADVVQMRIDADRGQRFQIELLKVRRRRLQDHLELVIVLQPVGVFAVAAVLRPPRRLHIGRVPAASGRARAAWSPDGRCPRPFPCRRAAGSRSRDPPSSAAAPGSSPGTSVPGAYGRAGNPSSDSGLARSGKRAGPYRRGDGESRQWRAEALGRRQDLAQNAGVDLQPGR